MALEIPDAIAVAAVVLFDGAADLGSRFVLESSAGILSKTTEFEVVFPGPSTHSAAVFTLEQPVSAKEACLLGGVSVANGPSFQEIIGYITPNAVPTGDATLDALPPNQLVMIAAAELKARCTLSVLRLPRAQS